MFTKALQDAVASTYSITNTMQKQAIANYEAMVKPMLSGFDPASVTKKYTDMMKSFYSFK